MMVARIGDGSWDTRGIVSDKETRYAIYFGQHPWSRVFVPPHLTLTTVPANTCRSIPGCLRNWPRLSVLRHFVHNGKTQLCQESLRQSSSLAWRPVSFRAVSKSSAGRGLHAIASILIASENHRTSLPSLILRSPAVTFPLVL